MTTPDEPQEHIPSEVTPGQDTAHLPPDAETRSTENAPGKTATDAGGTGKGRRTRLAGLSLALLAVGVVAVATWATLSTREAATPPADLLPNNAVEVINSTTTPIVQRYSPLTAADTLPRLDYAPDSAGWSEALRAAHQAQVDGRYTSAISQYSALVGSANTTESHDALWGLASAYADAGQTDLAIRAYSLFTYLRDDPRAAQAFFRMAEVQRAAGNWTGTQGLYEEYNKHAGPARHAVMLLRAELLGSSPDAIAIFKGVIDDNPQDVDLREALKGLANVYSALDQHEDALKLYDRLVALQKANPRPLLDNTGNLPDAQAADEMFALGDKAGAQKRLLDYIKNESNYADGRYLSLIELLKVAPTAIDSGTLDSLVAARVSFNAGLYDTALSQLDRLRARETDPARKAAAALLTGRAYSAEGNYTEAFNWYTGTLQAYPGSPEAAEASRRAGDMLREQASWDDALGAYNLAVTKYPQYPQSDIARLNGGVLAYRLEQRDTALGLLQPLTTRPELSPTLKAQAEFWTGKIEKSMAKTGWQNNLKQVSTLQPGSYFAFRANSILAGEPDGGPLVPTFAESKVNTETLGVQFEKEGAEREALFKWAASVGGVRAATPQTSTAESGISPRMSADPELQRAVALLRIGYNSEAYLAFRLLADRLASAKDASGLAEVMTYLRYHADTRTAMTVAEKLAEMDKTGDQSRLPALLLKTLYPTPYSDLVLPEAETRNIDPLVMYALMRQESQFVPDAQSGADARGLTQVVPSTGAGIAEQLGDPTFLSDMLYVPYVNIRYGTYYLASNLPQFDRKLLPALAAYNGGPGNASRWLSGSALFDPDLYTERIDLFETGDYLDKVYVNYGYYKQAYAR